MKNTIITVLFFVVLSNCAFAEPNAAPEPWLGNKAEKYCNNAISGLTDPDKVCRNITNQLVGKLHRWCKDGTSVVCTVTFGYKEKCKLYLDELVCPEVNDAAKRLEEGEKRPWLDSKLDKLCHRTLNPLLGALAERKGEFCAKIKKTVEKECVNILVDICEKAVSSSSSAKAKMEKLSVLLEDEIVGDSTVSKKSSRRKSKSKHSRKARKSRKHRSADVEGKGILSSLKSVCKSKVAKSVYHKMCS